MKTKLKKIQLLCVASILFATQGCTIATHDVKNKFWAMQPDTPKLPSVSIIENSQGYVSYPLLFSRKQLFQNVATCGDVFPVEIEVKITTEPTKNIFSALSWLIISGSSAYIIPYRGSNPRHAEFTVNIDGNKIKTFKYDDTKYTWIATFGMFAGALSQKNDEYYVEELIADQFVNSFIIDLHKDNDLIDKIKTSSKTSKYGT